MNQAEIFLEGVLAIEKCNSPDLIKKGKTTPAS